MKIDVFHTAQAASGEAVAVIGGGLAGSEAALQLADRRVPVVLYEMRPVRGTAVHRSSLFGELVCSNSLKSLKAASAAGMLKEELSVLGSHLIRIAYDSRVPAGGALAVDRDQFARRITEEVERHPLITVARAEVESIEPGGRLILRAPAPESLAALDLTPLPDEGPDGDPRWITGAHRALILATGPLTSDALASFLQGRIGGEELAFYDAAAPIVMADSLEREQLFTQDRYEQEAAGDYLNAPMDKERYERFIDALISAERVMPKAFETKELFSACQPIEEIARKGVDAPRYGPMKPVGLIDPRTGHRPWAVVQLRAEDAAGSCYNLVGFQTNLSFPEQRRVFSLIPGLEKAEFARYGVMHRNTFLNAPALLQRDLSFREGFFDLPVFVAGQLSGTEGYAEAIMAGLYAALAVCARLRGRTLPSMPPECAFGSLVSYATSPETVDYQPMHVNFGIIAPLAEPCKNKGKRYAAYAERGHAAIRAYRDELARLGLMPEGEA